MNRLASKFSLLILLAVCAVTFGAEASAKVEPGKIAKIVSAGVPSKSLQRILTFLEKYEGDEVLQETYTCEGKDPSDIKPCEEEKRTKASKKIKIVGPRYVAVVDFSLPSTEKRLFVIDLETAEVTRYLTTHGKGSGESRWAFKFSNIKDSKQSSLGLYQLGEVYSGKYGSTMRMYGLERSNDQAFNRDIVLHGAHYAREKFITSINPKTKKPFGRLGLSHGCPAVSPDVQKKILPLLRDGSIIDLYHPKLMEEAQSGKEVSIEEPQDASPGEGPAVPAEDQVKES